MAFSCGARSAFKLKEKDFLRDCMKRLGVTRVSGILLLLYDYQRRRAATRESQPWTTSDST